MEEKKEFFEAEVVTDSPQKKNNFRGDFTAGQFKDLKKTLLLKGGFYLAFWIVIALLVLSGIIALIFWLLPIFLYFILAVFLLGLIVNLVSKLYSMFKK